MLVNDFVGDDGNGLAGINRSLLETLVILRAYPDMFCLPFHFR